MVTSVDPEVAVVAWLKSAFGSNGVRVVTELPAKLLEACPLLMVNGIGGSDTDHILDDARIDVSAFAATRSAARTLARQAKDSLRFDCPGRPLTTPDGRVFISEINTNSLPKWVPYDDTDVRRFEATYQVILHTLHP